MLKAKTIRDRPAAEDGYRLLITREWPARLPASGADGFNPQLAPSDKLYADLLAHRIGFEEFGRRYGAELDEQKERLAKLVEQAKEFDITLVAYDDFEGKSISQLVLDRCGAVPADTKKSAKAVIEEYAEKIARKEGMEKQDGAGKNMAKEKEGKGMKKQNEGKNMEKEKKNEKKKTPAAGRKKNHAAAGFRFLEHTADIKVEAWGGDFAAALKQAALAMFSVLGSGRASEKMEIDERAADREQLVVGLLSRILAECDARELLAVSIDIIECDGKKPHAKAVVGLARTRPKDAIKAVTYHQLEVEETKNKCTIRVVFDV